jgi:ClpP class serine protease
MTLAVREGGMSVEAILLVIVLCTISFPVARQRYVEILRRRAILAIEKKRHSRVISLIHREESINLFGIPVVKFLNMNDLEEIMRAIHLTDPATHIDFILHTPGGLYLAATQIARALKDHKGKVTIFVPHYAMSGGTLIALAADEIVMSPHAVLGPIDPQIDDLPAASILEVIRQTPIAEIEDDTIILADLAKKAISQLGEIVGELLRGKLGASEIEKVSESLTSGVWTHDFAITFRQARELRLPVSTDIPNEVLELIALYPQPIMGTPSVEYLPTSARRRNAVDSGEARK